MDEDSLPAQRREDTATGALPLRIPVANTLGPMTFHTAVLRSGKRPDERENMGGRNNARLEAAAWNAFVIAGAQLNRDPADLAEEWQQRLADAISAYEAENKPMEP